MVAAAFSKAVDDSVTVTPKHTLTLNQVYIQSSNAFAAGALTRLNDELATWKNSHRKNQGV